jgi:hypothetical protein
VETEKAKLIITPEAVEVSGSGLRLSRYRVRPCHTPYASHSVQSSRTIESIDRVAAQPFRTVVNHRSNASC